MSCDFYPLKVQATRKLIDGQAKMIEFELRPEQRELFRWKAGQHLTLALEIQREEHRRSYTISSSPHTGDPLRITVKRVENGLISNFLNDEVEPGDVLQVMPPVGSFKLEPIENHQRTHYFFGAGSGITPLFAMLSSVLVKEPHSVCHLLFANKNEKSILFKEELDHLQKLHGKRLSVHHVLSAQSMWSSFKAWSSGKVDKKTIQKLIDEKPPYAQDTQYYICGPGTMNSDVKRSLKALDVPEERIHFESFGGHIEADDSVKGVVCKAEVNFRGQQFNFPIEAGQTVLEAALKAGLKPPYSCQSGVCGACRCQLRSGSAHLRVRMALEEHEIESGILLSCQALPTSKRLEIEW